MRLCRCSLVVEKAATLMPLRGDALGPVPGAKSPKPLARKLSVLAISRQLLDFAIERLHRVLAIVRTG